MAKSKLIQANKKIERSVINGYRKIEDTVVSGYQKTEDLFINRYLIREGEAIEAARERLKQKHRNKKVKKYRKY